MVHSMHSVRFDMSVAACTNVWHQITGRLWPYSLTSAWIQLLVKVKSQYASWALDDSCNSNPLLSFTPHCCIVCTTVTHTLLQRMRLPVSSQPWYMRVNLRAFSDGKLPCCNPHDNRLRRTQPAHACTSIAVETPATGSRARQKTHT